MRKFGEREGGGAWERHLDPGGTFITFMGPTEGGWRQRIVQWLDTSPWGEEVRPCGVLLVEHIRC